MGRPVRPSEVMKTGSCPLVPGGVTRMTERMVNVVIEVADVERSAVLYRQAFGVDIHLDDHEGGEAGAGERWTSGRHGAFSWTDGAYLHFAINPAKEDGPTRGVQLGFIVDDLAGAHRAAVTAGADVIHGPRHEGSWGPTARYRDFDGNVVSLNRPPGLRVFQLG